MTMRQAARKSFDAYLAAPRRSAHAHLHVAEDAPHPRRTRISDSRVPASDPAIEQPDWAEPFADPRWDDRLGEPPLTDQGGRRTVVVTGRPGPQHSPRRDRTPGPSARRRRVSPTRARLAGRPDRVALWAVALGLIMAAMAGFTGGGHSHSSHPADAGAPAPVFDR